MAGAAFLSLSVRESFISIIVVIYLKQPPSPLLEQ